MPTLLGGLYLRDFGSDYHTVSQWDRSIQATLITVGFGSFEGVTLTRASWRVSKLAAKLHNSEMAWPIMTKFCVFLETK